MYSCKKMDLLPIRKMRNASVILVYSNEAPSAILRTVHSIVNRSPPEILHEVILFDDASDRGKFCYIIVRSFNVSRCKIIGC